MRRSRFVNLAIAVVVGVVCLAGLLLSGAVGAVLLVVVATVLVALSASAWQRIPSRGRGMRLLVVVGVLFIAGLKLAS